MVWYEIPKTFYLDDFFKYEKMYAVTRISRSTGKWHQLGEV